MSICSVCQASVDGRFCPACGGANVTTMTAPAANAGLTENAAGALCYLGGPLTGVIFLAIAPYNRNPRVRFHAFQSILLSLVWALGWIAVVAVGMILPFSISAMVSLFSMLLWGGGLLLWLLLLWKAYQGETLALPAIGGLARRQAGK